MAARDGLADGRSAARITSPAYHRRQRTILVVTLCGPDDMAFEALDT